MRITIPNKQDVHVLAVFSPKKKSAKIPQNFLVFNRLFFTFIQLLLNAILRETLLFLVLKWSHFQFYPIIKDTKNDNSKSMYFISLVEKFHKSLN